MDAVKELKAYGIIEVDYRDVPRKRYFKFNVAEFNKLYYDVESIGKCDVKEEFEIVEVDTLDKSSNINKRTFKEDEKHCHKTDPKEKR